MQVDLQLGLLDAKGEVLAWNWLVGFTKGDGCIWSMQATFMAGGAQTGDAVELFVNWTEMNVHTFVPLPQTLHVDKGKVVGVPLTEPLLRFGSSDRPAPQVVVTTSVTVGVAAMSR